MIAKTSNGRWRARVKHQGVVIADRTFDRKADATSWEHEQKRLLGLGRFIDPRRAQEPFESVWARWMRARFGTVSSTTYKTDRSLIAYLPPQVRKRPIGAISGADIQRTLDTLVRSGLSRTTVTRFRGSISGTFSWAVREGILGANPVAGTKVPKGNAESEGHSVHPFTLAELREVVRDLEKQAGADAQVALVLALTGLRWGELVALRVRDVQLVPYPALVVSRSAPDNHPIKFVPKGGAARTVPIPAELVDVLRTRTYGRSGDELLFTAPEGGRLNGNNWKRKVRWAQLGRGRRVHDLRHTAATLWLNSGLDPKTVQKWLGHASMTLTVDLYSHWMGSDADRAAVKRFESALRGPTGQAPGSRSLTLDV